MSAFQILDASGEAISMGALDREVCELWEVPVDPKYYAKPYPREHYPVGWKGEWDYSGQPNWYDTIGWMIASENKSFQDILDYYADVMKEFIGRQDENGVTITLEYIYPKQTLLLNTWINKGYQPKQIIE